MSAKGEGGRGKAEGTPHIIRLRGPWLTDEGSRAKLPAVWRDALGNVATVSLSRNFNRPTNLDDSVRVSLRVESPQAVEQIAVNGTELADRADLGPLLEPSNRVTVTLSLRDANAAVLEAWLEIVER